MKKRMVLRISSCMMVAMLTLTSAIPAFAAEEVAQETESDASYLGTSAVSIGTETESTVDTTRLEELIAQASAYDEMSYTKASWDANVDAINAALTRAQTAAANKTSQDEVDDAYWCLKDAAKQLTKAGDQTELRALLDQVYALNSDDYTESSWNNLSRAVTSAENKLEARDTGRNLYSAQSKVSYNMNNLVKCYSLDSLKTMTAKAEALNESDYTEESWAKADLASAIENANDVISRRGNKESVEAAIDELDTAMDLLEKASEDESAANEISLAEISEDMESQLKELKDGSSLVLEGDVTLTADLTLKGGSIDLNGYTLNQADHLIRIKGDVSITDSSAEKSGQITSEKYADGNSTESSITVQKGSLTADGITIDGQIGNKVFNSKDNTLNNASKVSVILKNCNLSNSQGRPAVYFTYLSSGIEFLMDQCQSSADITVAYGSGEKSIITNSTLTGLSLSGAEVQVSGVKVNGSQISTISADSITLTEDEFSGLYIDGNADVVLESVESYYAGSANYGALDINGQGQVTIKDGTFEHTGGGYAIKNNGRPIIIQGGYFKGDAGSISGLYTTPAGEALGSVTRGALAGYEKLIDSEEGSVDDPAALVYDAEGKETKQLKDEDDTSLLLSYVEEGGSVKLNKDLTAGSLKFYSNCTLDLNGHCLTLTDSTAFITYGKGLKVIDSSTDKTGEVIADEYLFRGEKEESSLTLDGVNVQAAHFHGISNGSIFLTNGSKLSGVDMASMEPEDHNCTGKINVEESSISYADSNYTGLVEVANNTLYCKAGQVDAGYCGLEEINGETCYIENGSLSSKTDVVKVGNDWYNVVNGKLAKEVTIAHNSNGWWYIDGEGKVDFSYTGLAHNSNGWFYCENGKVKFDHTGLVQYTNGSWYYVENSKLNGNYTGLCKHGNDWYYVEKGVLNWNYSGLCKYGDSWYYVENGKLNWNFTNLTYYNGTWYYVEKGVLNWNYTNLFKYNGSWYYVEKGKINWNFTSLFKYNGTWYYVEKGKLNWNFTGLTKYYSTWYYVQKGVLNWNYTGFVKHTNGVTYYVQKGKIDFSYSGTVSGKKVVKGVVQ
jgi:hypothetical protein